MKKAKKAVVKRGPRRSRQSKRSQSVFSARMAQERRDRNMSQGDVGRQLGITPAGVSCLENNPSNVRLEHVRRLAVMFGVTSDWLLGISDVREPQTNNDVALLTAKIRLLPVEKRVFLDNVIFSLQQMGA